MKKILASLLLVAGLQAHAHGHNHGHHRWNRSNFSFGIQFGVGGQFGIGFFGGQSAYMNAFPGYLQNPFGGPFVQNGFQMGVLRSGYDINHNVCREIYSMGYGGRPQFGVTCFSGGGWTMPRAIGFNSPSVIVQPAWTQPNIPGQIQPYWNQLCQRPAYVGQPGMQTPPILPAQQAPIYQQPYQMPQPQIYQPMPQIYNQAPMILPMQQQNPYVYQQPYMYRSQPLTSNTTVAPAILNATGSQFHSSQNLYGNAPIIAPIQNATR